MNHVCLVQDQMFEETQTFVKHKKRYRKKKSKNKTKKSIFTAEVNEDKIDKYYQASY